MSRKIIALVVALFTLCMVGCADNAGDIEYNKIFSEEMEVLIADSLEEVQKAYVIKEDDSQITICINMGEIDYSYYCMEYEETDEAIVCTISKKNANHDGEAQNIMRATISVEDADKDIEVWYDGKILNSEEIYVQ